MKRTFAFTVATALAGMLVYSVDAFAAKGGIPGPPGGETLAQSLSVPTIMVGTPAGGLYCGNETFAPTELVPPPGPSGLDPLYYEVPLQTDVYWWVQKVHTWQAQCLTANSAEVFGAWGDNLEGDAKLKAGSPIRVEIVLNNTEVFDLDVLPETLQGYNVIKLEPDKLDRESAYGHPAVDDPDNGDAVPIDFPQLTTGTGETAVQGWLVHDALMTFSVLNKDTGVYAVDPGTFPTAEINATGKVVYGYNLRLGEPGHYRIQFTSSDDVVFTDVDAGGMEDSNNVWIDITVVTGGGGGKGKP